MSINDLFGPFPGRPDHPDLTKLVNVVLQIDGKTEDPDFDMDEYLGTLIDATSVSYMALQRALRMMRQLSIDVDDSPMSRDILSAFASLWIDGFVVGHEVE